MFTSQNKKTKSKNGCWLFSIFGMNPDIVKASALLLLMSVLLLGCATQVEEPRYTDMYETRQYEVRTITNEIITTTFVARYVETNAVKIIAEPITDFGGYEFKPIGEEAEVEFEFQCTDGSCEVKK